MQDPSVKPFQEVDPQRAATRSPLLDRLAAVAQVILVSGFPTQFAIGLLLLSAGLDAKLPDGHLSMTYVVTLWVLDAAAIFAIVAALVHARGETLGPLLIGNRPLWKEACLGLVLVPAVFGMVTLVLLAVGLVWPGLHNVPTNPFEDLIRRPRDAGILAAVAVLSGGIKEEVQRAFALRQFERHLGGAWVGVVIFSAMFGAGHFIQGWDVGVVTTLLGAFWGVLYLRRRSIAASVVSHSGFNVAQILRFAIFGS